MKSKLNLNRLKTVLPTATIEALDSEGFFDAPEAIVKRRQVNAPVESLEEGERAAIRYISTRDVDRDREVLVPKGAMMDHFQLAPQVLWGHDYSLPPIGKAEWVAVDDYGLKSKTVYAETERAEEVWQLVKGGFLSTASVGFLPIERTFKGQQGWAQTVEKLNRAWQTDLEAAGAEIVTTKWSLLEYSDVPVPANPYALVTAIAKGLNIQPEMLEALGLDEDLTPVIEASTEPRRFVIPFAQTPKRVIELVSTPRVDPRVIAIETINQMRGKV